MRVLVEYFSVYRNFLGVPIESLLWCVHWLAAWHGFPLVLKFLFSCARVAMTSTRNDNSDFDDDLVGGFGKCEKPVNQNKESERDKRHKVKKDTNMLLTDALKEVEGGIPLHQKDLLGLVNGQLTVNEDVKKNLHLIVQFSSEPDSELTRFENSVLAPPSFGKHKYLSCYDAQTLKLSAKQLVRSGGEENEEDILVQLDIRSLGTILGIFQL